jgi:hypothetical protein
VKLTVKRLWPFPSCTIGQLYVDGLPECYTLEDTVRPHGEKVPGKTAIPEGEYRVIITESQRFGRRLPILLDVPNFSGIRIHAGNTMDDTEGCILVGETRGHNCIGCSRAALEKLMAKLESSTDEIRISIEGVD